MAQAVEIEMKKTEANPKELTISDTAIENEEPEYSEESSSDSDNEDSDTAEDEYDYMDDDDLNTVEHMVIPR